MLPLVLNRFSCFGGGVQPNYLVQNIISFQLIKERFWLAENEKSATRNLKCLLLARQI